MDETHTPTFALLLKRHSHTFALLLKRHFCTFALYANWWKVRKCESARESFQQKCNSAPRCLLTHFCFCTFVEETLSHFCTFALLLKRFPRTFALSLKRLRRTFALLLKTLSHFRTFTLCVVGVPILAVFFSSFLPSFLF